MVPKILHFCWFGTNEKNNTIRHCIESWKKYCPNYQIIEWNETNFDVNMNPYTKEAYENKKFAFVTDYVRLYALFHYGGIYVDSDLEIRKNIDCFLKHKAFTSFEDGVYVPTAIMGAQIQHPWIKRLLDYYSDASFIDEDGKMKLTTNTKIITDICTREYGLIQNNRHQIIDDDVHIYPREVFCVNLVDKINYSVHHFNGSWLSEHYTKADFLKYQKNYMLVDKLIQWIESGRNHFGDDILGKRLVIYGLGNVAKLLIHYLRIINVDIDVIIISNGEDGEYKGIPVFNLENFVNYSDDTLIVVTPSYDFNNICTELNKYTNADIISVEYLLGMNIMY